MDLLWVVGTLPAGGGAILGSWHRPLMRRVENQRGRPT
jgi:hypothetical protein